MSWMSQHFLWPPKMRVTARRKHEYVRLVWLFGTAQEAQKTRHPGAFQINNNATCTQMPFDVNNKQHNITIATL